MPNAGACHVLVMSLAFMFLMTASQIFTFTLVFIESLRFKEFNFATIGFGAIIIEYCTFAAVVLFIPPVIRLIGPKNAMLMGSFSYIIFMLSQLFPFVPSVCVTSISVGVGSALLWVGHGNYLVRNSTERNISSHCVLFWATSQISTFLASAFVYFRFFDVSFVDEKTRFSIIWLLLGLCCISTVIFILLPKSIHEDALSVNWQDRPNFTKMMFSAGRMAKSGHMLLLYVPCFLLGLNSVFLGMTYGTVVGHTMLLERPKQLAPMTSIFIGLGEVIGAGSLVIFGSSNEKTRRNVIFIFGGILSILALLLIFINLPNESSFGETDDTAIIESSAILVIGSSFMMGIADACLNTQIMAHLSLNYPRNSAIAFAVMKFIQAIGALVAVLFAEFVFLYGVVLILIGVTIFTTISFIVSERIDVDEHKVFVHEDKNRKYLDAEGNPKSHSSDGLSPKPSPIPSTRSSTDPGPSTHSSGQARSTSTTTRDFSSSIGSLPFTNFETPPSSSQPISLAEKSTSIVLKETLYDIHPELSKQTSLAPSDLPLSSQSLQLTQKSASEISKKASEPFSAPVLAPSLLSPPSTVLLAPPPSPSLLSKKTSPSLGSEEKSELLEPKPKPSFLRKLLGVSEISSKPSVPHSISTIVEEDVSDLNKLIAVNDEGSVDQANLKLFKEHEQLNRETGTPNSATATEAVTSAMIDPASLAEEKSDSSANQASDSRIQEENERLKIVETTNFDAPIESVSSEVMKSASSTNEEQSEFVNEFQNITDQELGSFQSDPDRYLTETVSAPPVLVGKTSTGMSDVPTNESEQTTSPVEVDKTKSKPSLISQEEDSISLKITPILEETPVQEKQIDSVPDSEDDQKLGVYRRTRKKSSADNISVSEDALRSGGTHRKQSLSRKKEISKSEKKLATKGANRAESQTTGEKIGKPRKRTDMLKKLLSGPEELLQKSSADVEVRSINTGKTLPEPQNKRRNGSSPKQFSKAKEPESLLSRKEERSDAASSKTPRKRSLRRNDDSFAKEV